MDKDGIIELIEIYRELFPNDIQCVYSILSKISSYKGESWYAEDMYNSKDFLDFLYEENKISHLMYKKVIYNDDYIIYSTVDDIFNALYNSYYLDKINNFMDVPEGIEKTEFYNYTSNCLCNHFLAKYISQNKEELNIFFEETLYYFIERNESFDLFETDYEEYEKYFEEIYDILKIYYLIENKYSKYILKYDKQLEMQKKEDDRIRKYKKQEEMLELFIDSEEDVVEARKELLQLKTKRYDTNYSLSY